MYLYSYAGERCRNWRKVKKRREAPLLARSEAPKARRAGARRSTRTTRSHALSRLRLCTQRSGGRAGGIPGARVRDALIGEERAHCTNSCLRAPHALPPRKHTKFFECTSCAFAHSLSNPFFRPLISPGRSASHSKLSCCSQVAHMSKVTFAGTSTTYYFYICNCIVLVSV